MNDQDKSRDQLVQELESLRRRLAEWQSKESARPDAETKEVSGFFMGLLQHAPTPIFVKSAEKRFLLVNRAWEETMGLKQEAVVGRHVTELFPAATAQAFADTDDQVIQSGAPLSFEEFLDFPGERRWYHTVKFPLRGHSGQIKAVGGIAIDITKRKLTEEAVRDSEERYRLLFDGNLAGVYRATLAGRLLDCNEAFARILGYESRAEVLARPLAELHANPADWETLCSRLKQQGLLTNYESCLRRKDGGLVRALESVSLATPLAPSAQRRSGAAEAAGDPLLQGTLIDISERWRTRQELVAERHLLRTLMDNVPDTIYFKDMDSRFTRVNKALAEHFGLSDPGAAVGRTDFDFFTEEHARQAYIDEAKVMQTGQGLIGKEEKETWPDGRVTWAATSKMPLRDPEGKIIGTFGVSRDITARKHAEEALRLSETRLRTALRAARLGTWEVDLLTGQVIWDAEAEAMFGLAPGQFEGSQDAFYSRVHPDDRPMLIELFDQAVAARSNYEVEFRIIWPDGSLHWHAGWARPMYDDSGRPVRLVGVDTDITERKRAEAVLRETNQTLQAIVQSSPLPVMAFTFDGRTTLWNPAAQLLFGWTPGEIIGQVPDFIPEDKKAERQSLLETVAGGESITGFETRRKRKDGTEVDVILSAAPLRDAEGRITAALGVLADITERKRLEAQLRHAGKMEALGQLAGGIAHDFNNLLTAILGNVSLLLSAVADHEPNRDLLRDIERAASRATELTGQLLGFSRHTFLRLEPTQLNDVVRETVAILRWTIDPRIALGVQTCPNLWLVHADLGQMNQVLINLCINARDAMPQGGRLVLDTSNVVVGEEHARHYLDARPGEFVRLRVRDTGQGIPAEVLPRIYDPFFTTKGPGKGTGLGLAMVFGIVKQHQGWIECQSEVGKGTTFDIYLPRTPPLASAREGDARGAPASEVLTTGPPGGGQETILLVDDEAIIRNLGRTILQRYGYQVLLAEDGQDALDIFRKRAGRIDLVILDLTMPRLSGRDTLRQLLQIDPAVRVLFSSGYSAEQITAEDRGEVLGFVNKPYRPQDLARTVRAALDRVKA